MQYTEYSEGYRIFTNALSLVAHKLSSTAKSTKVLELGSTAGYIRDNLLHKDVLVVGDGDFSFSAYLSREKVCKSLTATTLDNYDMLVKSHPNASRNIQEVISNGYNVEYEINALNLSSTYIGNSFDVIFWNFPHVAGKANIRYNRLLLGGFLNATIGILSSNNRVDMITDGCQEVCKDNGCVLVSLCDGQSGLECESALDWKSSWKLLDHAANANLMVSECMRYDVHELQGYNPRGYRGHGGGFHFDNAMLYRMTSSPNQAFQASLYAQDFHIVELKRDMIDSLLVVENDIRDVIRSISFDYEFSDALWTVHLVDIYEVPGTQGVALVIQTAYSCLLRALTRDEVKAYGKIIMSELPRRTDYEMRAGLQRSEVSMSYPWYVAEQLKTCSLQEIHEILPEANAIIPESDKIQAIARSLWRKRAGVIFRDEAATVVDV